MRLIKARVQNYRSVIDSGFFEVEFNKSILVGPNEAGKTSIIQALQKLNPPSDVAKFEALRDYPRSKYNDITIGKVKPENVIVVEGHFILEPKDKVGLPPGYETATYIFQRKMDNEGTHELIGGPTLPIYADIEKDLNRDSGVAGHNFDSEFLPECEIGHA